MKPDELSDRLLDFAVRTAKVVDALPATAIVQWIMENGQWRMANLDFPFSIFH